MYRTVQLYSAAVIGRYRDDAASYASNRVENGARGPENEPFKGAGSHALGAQSFRRRAMSIFWLQRPCLQILQAQCR